MPAAGPALGYDAAAAARRPLRLRFGWAGAAARRSSRAGAASRPAGGQRRFRPLLFYPGPQASVTGPQRSPAPHAPVSRRCSLAASEHSRLDSNSERRLPRMGERGRVWPVSLWTVRTASLMFALIRWPAVPRVISRLCRLLPVAPSYRDFSAAGRRKTRADGPARRRGGGGGRPTGARAKLARAAARRARAQTPRASASGAQQAA